MKTNIKDLPLKLNSKYKMTISEIYHSSIVVTIDSRRFYISIPKNASWIHTHLYEDMVCIVKKEQYGDKNQYAKLTYIETIEDTYYKEENNYKETTSYNSDSKYYEILECGIDSSFDKVKQNYRKLIRAYHYDTLASKNLPADMLEYAQNKAKLINEAYEVLKLKR